MPDYSNLNHLKKKLDSHRPLPREIVSNLHDDLVLRWTYHSNAIEGNQGGSGRHHHRRENHAGALRGHESPGSDLLRGRLVKKDEPLSEWQVKSVHQLILKNIDDKNAGIYRKTNIVISGAEHVPPDALMSKQICRISSIGMSPMDRLSILWNGPPGRMPTS